MEDKPNNQKKDVGQIFLEEITGRGPKHKKGALGQTILIPVLAVFTGLVLGAVFILLTTVEVYTAFGKSFLDGLQVSWSTIATAYSALLYGSIGNPATMISAIHSGNQKALIDAFNPILESLVATTPYIFAGLAVALGFRGGVFNIGAEGQLYMGAIFSVYAGYSIVGVPAIIHIPLALLAGALGGAIWGFIPGWLKAKTGAHEVINTIMLNYVAFHFSEWMLNGPMKRPGYDPISPTIQPSAMLPVFFPAPTRLHLGFIIALAVAFLVYWYLFKTTWGFELRTVGANLFAAKYAGMNITRTTILAMTLSGALAGLSGANEVLGVNHNLALSFSSGYGFNSIALALLGGSHPLGVVLASLLFGTLSNGATQMQVAAGIPIDIISVLQGIILAFVAAPAIIRTIYRLRTPSAEQDLVPQGMGGD